MDFDPLLIASVTFFVWAFDFRYRDLDRWVEERFGGNDFAPSGDGRRHAFFRSRGKVLKYAGLALLWAGLVGITLFRKAPGDAAFALSIALFLLGSLTYCAKDFWLFFLERRA